MHVRNFWATIKAGDRVVETGSNGDDNFSIKVQMRRHGDPISALFVTGLSKSDGTLELQVCNERGTLINTFTTER